MRRILHKRFCPYYFAILIFVIIIIAVKLFTSSNNFTQSHQYKQHNTKNTSIQVSSVPAKTADGMPKKIILIWTPVENNWPYPSLLTLPSEDCYSERCVVAYNNPALLDMADAVVFHATNIDNTIIDNLPPVISNRINVYFIQETIHSVVRNAKANFRLPHNYFHWTMTFLSKSDIHWPYGGYFFAPEKASQMGLPPLKLPYDEKTILKDKEIKGAIWLVSNCNSYNKRELAVKVLSKYTRIDIGGQCGNKRLCPRTEDGSMCEGVIRKYYFYIAVENAICNEYITEKYWNHFALPVILVVMRRSIYEKLVPPQSFIAMDDFAGPKEMAAYLNHLMDNPDAYIKHFEWRSQNWSLAPLNSEGYRIGMCDLCDKLWKNSSLPVPISDVVKWFNDTLECVNGEEFVRKWTKIAQ